LARWQGARRAPEEEADRTPDNQEAVLRWNACARIISANPSVKPDEADNSEMLLDSFERPH
jgi:hypothetical protein